MKVGEGGTKKGGREKEENCTKNGMKCPKIASSWAIKKNALVAAGENLKLKPRGINREREEKFIKNRVKRFFLGYKLLNKKILSKIAPTAKDVFAEKLNQIFFIERRNRMKKCENISTVKLSGRNTSTHIQMLRTVIIEITICIIIKF